MTLYDQYNHNIIIIIDRFYIIDRYSLLSARLTALMLHVILNE